MAAVPGWVADYIGIPFIEAGRDRSGADCWGLARLVWGERFGFWVPLLSGEYERLEDRDRLAQVATTEQARHWQAVAAGSEQLGDAILLRIVGRPIHVGVVIAPGRMLHTEQTTGAVIEGYTGRKWAQRLCGFYRWSGG